MIKRITNYRKCSPLPSCQALGDAGKRCVPRNINIRLKIGIRKGFPILDRFQMKQRILRTKNISEEIVYTASSGLRYVQKKIRGLVLIPNKNHI